MRIAQLANFVSPTSGGMRVAIEELGKGYVEAGHERLLIIPGERDQVVETERGLIATIASPKVSEQYRMVVRPWRATEVLRRFRPTSIEVSDKWTLTGAGEWARRHGVGSVLFSHERLTDMLAMWLRWGPGVRAGVGALNRRLASRFDAVVVTSRFAAEEFRSVPGRVELVPLGVDLCTFHPRHGAPIDDGVLKLCYVGRLSHEKSPQLAVETAVELHRRGHRLRLDMYGTGPDRAALAKLAGDTPVRFMGFLAEREEVASAFVGHDLSLSVCPAETFGLAVLEALACGTPVVTSNRGGAHEVVDATSGAHGAPDAVSLADAVESLLPRLGSDFRAAARARAESYSWGRAVERMLTLHASVG
ncbi:glycosyltransferase [Tessaracoccus caeni]|uniref:glycosyltransferase n=1 Tax=Tessaracoccus caeni TaxID=3031239 RepID=UPI0029E81387|nr:glycosyltransferase [Tessaracoccus caeni]